MTRAPSSASWRVANGPAITCSSATTVMPSSGLCKGHFQPLGADAADLRAPGLAGRHGMRIGQGSGADELASRKRRSVGLLGGAVALGGRQAGLPVGERRYGAGGFMNRDQFVPEHAGDCSISSMDPSLAWAILGLALILAELLTGTFYLPMVRVAAFC